MKFYALTTPQCGGKAWNLGRLQSLGFDVPPGFVVKESFRDPAQWITEIEKIGGFPVAVRSSGSLEDSAAFSFAGQFKTFLNISSVAELELAVENCFASATSFEVQSYMKAKGLRSELQMSVVIQKMIQPLCAGVAFSMHPMTGQEELGLVEWTAGLGDKLVDGSVSPHRWTLHLFSGAVTSFEPGEGEQALGPEFAQLFCETLLDIQAKFGQPQDIEWAVDTDRKLWILQARPITSYFPRTDVDEHTSSDLRDGGVSAQVITPLMSSLYKEAFCPAMEEYVHRIRLSDRGPTGFVWMENYYGRLFWNVTPVKALLAQLPGFDEKKFDQDLGIQKNYDLIQPIRTPVSLKSVLYALPVAFFLQVDFFRNLRKTFALERSFAPVEKDYLQRIEGLRHLADHELTQFFIKIDLYQNAVEKLYFNTIFNTSNAQTELKTSYASIEKNSSVTLDFVALLTGLTGVSHMSVIDEMHRLAQVSLAQGFESSSYLQEEQQFLKHHYFHADSELNLLEPRWIEVPELIRERIRTLCHQPLQAERSNEVATSLRRELKTVFRSCLRRGAVLPWLYFRYQLSWVRTLLQRKESVRQISTKTYYFYRRIVLELSRRMVADGTLSSEADIFFFERTEIEELFRTRRVDHAQLNLRKRLHSGYRDFKPPLEFGGKIKPAQVLQTGRQLVGVPGSPGQFEGTARVLSSIEQLSELKSGEILVTQFTDPGWTPAFSLISAVVTEVGGILSHAAIIGRELGIPVVLSVPGCSSKIKTGDRLRVDGSNGFVELLDFQPTPGTPVESQPEETTSANRTLWSSENLNENYPQAVSPLLASIAPISYAHYFRGMARNLGISKKVIAENENYFHNLVQPQRFRLYYNLSAIHHLLLILPYGEHFVRSFNAFVGAFDADLESENTRITPRRAGTGALRLGLHAVLNALLLPQRIRRFAKKLEGVLKIEPRSRAAMEEKWRGFFALRFNSWHQVSFADFLAMLGFSAVGKTLIVFDLAGTFKVHDLLQGRNSTASMDPAKDLWLLQESIVADPVASQIFNKKSALEITKWLRSSKVAGSVGRCANTERLATQIEAYLDKWGFRCSQELMLTEPTLSENPLLLIELLKTALQDQRQSHEKTGGQSSGKSSGAGRLGAQIGKLQSFRQWVGLPILWTVAAFARFSIQQREKVRMMQARLYADFRTCCLSIGESFVASGNLDKRDDIFFLTFRQIEEAFLSSPLAKANTLREQVCAHRFSFETETKENLPAAFWRQSDGSVQAFQKLQLAGAAAPLGSLTLSRQVQGRAVSGGQIQARPRVIRDLRQCANLRPGEILVVPQTDPGWVSLFPLASGLIIERGGMLSHGSILAREFGIPAMIGEVGLCDQLENYSGEIYLDGDAGSFAFIDRV